MTTHPMSVRKFMKQNNLFRHDYYEREDLVPSIMAKLESQGYVRVATNSVRPIAIVDGKMIPYTTALNALYQWCHKQLGTKNWVKVHENYWFTNDYYRAMFVLTWVER